MITHNRMAFILLIFLAAATTAARCAAETKLTVLTANVGNMKVSRADYYRQFKINEYDLPVLKDNLDRIAADIVFLQELDSEGMHQENVVFNKDYAVKCAGELCVAVKKKTIEFLEDCVKKNGYIDCSAHVVSKRTATEKCGKDKKGYYCSSRRDLPDAEIIKLFNVHTSSPSDDKSFAIRRAQICDMYTQALAYDKIGMKVLIAGDFNFDPFVYESSAYNKRNEKDDLFRLGVCWRDALSGSAGSGKLARVSPDEPTWFTKEFKFFLVKEQVYRTMDHVITNIKSDNCRVLNGAAARIDADRTGRPNPRDTFMDHRAVMCNVSL